MRPIDDKVDVAFSQALRCVEFRLPVPGHMRRNGYLHALAVRYGMMGATAIHTLIGTLDRQERLVFFERLPVWADLVEEHVRWETIGRLPIEMNSSTPSWLARQSSDAVQIYLPLQRQNFPLDLCLDVLSEEYLKGCIHQINAEWPWLKRRAAVQMYRESAQESHRLAMNFYERRQCGLEELPEIALLGE